VPNVVYIQHENTFLHYVRKAKPPVIEIEKWLGTAKPEGEVRAGIESLSLWN